MSEERATRERSLWQRCRRPVLTAVAAVLLYVVSRVFFPDMDFSRGSPDRWWFIGAFGVLALVVFVVQRVLGRRRGAEDADDAST